MITLAIIGVILLIAAIIVYQTHEPSDDVDLRKVNPQGAPILNTGRIDRDLNNTQRIQARTGLITAHNTLQATDKAGQVEQLILDNKIAALELATQMGVPFEHMMPVLTQILTLQVGYETKLLDAKLQLETERISAEDTIKFILAKKQIEFNNLLLTNNQLLAARVELHT